MKVIQPNPNSIHFVHCAVSLYLDSHELRVTCFIFCSGVWKANKGMISANTLALLFSLNPRWGQSMHHIILNNQLDWSPAEFLTSTSWLTQTMLLSSESPTVLCLPLFSLAYMRTTSMSVWNYTTLIHTLNIWCLPYLHTQKKYCWRFTNPCILLYFPKIQCKNSSNFFLGTSYYTRRPL